MNSSVGIVGVGIFGAVTGHMTLEATPKALAFLGELSTLLQCEFLKLSNIGSINIHWDMIRI
jgi:hypothetical protein